MYKIVLSMPVLTLCFLYGGVGCKETKLTEYPPPSPSEGGMMGGSTGGSIGGSMGGMEMNSNPIGKACETTCDAGLCLSQEYLATLGVENPRIQIPNGLCSRFCTSNEECGDGALCFNTQPFSGAPVSICLQECSSLIDCRWEEEYGCYSPKDFDEDEADTPLCLPHTLAAEIYCNQEGASCPTPEAEDPNGMEEDAP